MIQILDRVIADCLDPQFECLELPGDGLEILEQLFQISEWDEVALSEAA